MADDNFITKIEPCLECGVGTEIKYMDLFGSLKRISKYCPKCADKNRIENIIEKQEREARNKQHRLEQMFKQSELGKRFHEATFESYEVNALNKEAYAKAKTYVLNWEDNQKSGRGLIFAGSKGTGKSHLMAAITHELLAKGATVIYQSTPDLIIKIKGTFDPNGAISESKIYQALIDMDLLMIDDIGTEYKTEWSETVIYTIINARYQDMKPTIFSTNLTPKDFENRVGERVADRVFETSEIVLMSWQSYRLNKQLPTG